MKKALLSEAMKPEAIEGGSSTATAAIQQAQHQLAELEKLLQHPTPKVIRDSEILLSETSSLLQQCGRAIQDGSAKSESLRADLELFQNSCHRVHVLLEGSLKIQCSRMRSIGSFTQTYTPNAKTKAWTPNVGTVNIHL